MSEKHKDIDLDEDGTLPQKKIYRQEFVKILALELKNRGGDYSIQELSFIMNAMFYVISELIKIGYTVSILNVGSFMRKTYKDRVYKDHVTGVIEKVIQKHLVTKFKASENFGVLSDKILKENDIIRHI